MLPADPLNLSASCTRQARRRPYHLAHEEASMTQRVPGTHRREFLRVAAAATGSAIMSGGLFIPIPALAQDPPDHCPALPTGGTKFKPGQDKRPIVTRKAIGSLSTSELTQLHDAFTKLRA